MNSLSQNQQLKLFQKLSPQQIQGIKLLELPTQLLEVRVKQEVEDNIVLEEIEIVSPDDLSSSRSTLDDFIKAEDSSSSYKYRTNNYSRDTEIYTPSLSDSKSLRDYLLEQLPFFDLLGDDLLVAYFLIGSLEDNGYLRRDSDNLLDDLAFTQGIVISKRDLDLIITILQRLEPVGIFARDLYECLLLQLNRLFDVSETRDSAIFLLEHYFVEFLRKHYDKIRMRMDLSEDDFRKVLDLIMALNPKPANGYSDENMGVINTILPDFVLLYDNINDIFDLQLSGGHVPELRINNSYLRLAESTLNGGGVNSDKEALVFVKQKIDSAKWFISAIKQREQTLLSTMWNIVRYQLDYFKDGDLSMLHPMILKDIANMTGYDISTISRVVNSKYIQTHFGLFLLKSFFSEGLFMDSGEEVSTLEIKSILRDLVNSENPLKPLNDEQLMNLLRDRGFLIARRTVAKYREMMNIPVSRLRRGIR